MRDSYIGLGLSFTLIAVLIVIGFLVGASPYIATAHAANANVALALRNTSDLSMFYEAMVNSGVMGELDENQHYTIFAPVNTSFSEIPPQTYPCFYAKECRPQIAELVRDHIVTGRHDLAKLSTYGRGIKSDGTRHIHIREAYVGDYTADGRRILSKSEVDGNIIYRVDGFLASRQQLAQFQAVNFVPASMTDDGTSTEKTITTKSYVAPMTVHAIPGVSSSAYGSVANDQIETTTVTRRTTILEPE